MDLTERQIQVLTALLMEPDTVYSQLARELEISESTFKAHLSRASDALGVKTARAALIRCLELGIIDP